MRKLSLISLAVIVAIGFTNCNPLKKMKKNSALIQYSMTPEVLEMHADSITINISGKYPEKYFNKKVTMLVKPSIKWEGGEKALKTVTLQGEKVTENNQVIKVAGGSFSYTDKVAYESGMEFSKVMVNATPSIKTKSLEFDAKEVGKGTIMTPKLLVIDPKTISAKDNFVRITSESKEADINFAIQQAGLKNDELSKEDMKGLKAYLEEVLKSENKEFKGFAVSSYASPDGAEDINAKLADGRGVTGQKVITDQMKAVKTAKGDEKAKSKLEKAQDKSLYTTQATAEDWAGFEKLMKASDVPDKDLILRVLSMYSDPVRRETEIKNISAVYTKIAENVLPQLRRSVMKVNVDVVGYSDEELITLSSSKPDTLNIEELLYAANLIKDANKRLEIYNKAGELRNDWRAYNNAGVEYFAMNKLTEAKQAFQKAKSLKDGEKMVMNNIGAIAILEGDLKKAEEDLASASGAGSEVNYNLGIIAVKKADYEGAARYFGSDCSFNAALATLLGGDADGASKKVDCIKDKETAMNYYLKAITGARTGNSEIVLNNLRAAVGKDASLGAKAKTDMEFRKFFEDETFKSIAR